MRKQASFCVALADGLRHGVLLALGPIEVLQVVVLDGLPLRLQQLRLLLDCVLNRILDIGMLTNTSFWNF